MKNYLDKAIISAKLVKIKWERIFMHLYIQIDIHDKSFDLKRAPLSFYAVEKITYTSPAQFRVMDVNDNIYHIRLNVTNTGENQCLPSNPYMIEVCQEDIALADCIVDESIVTELADDSRNFVYGQGNKCYSISFRIEEGLDSLVLEFVALAASRVEMSFPSKTHLHTRLDPIQALQATWLKHKNIIRNIYEFYSIFHQSNRKKTVLFLTEQNNKITSNLKAVSDRMLERGLDKDYKIMYSARSASSQGQSIISWLKMLKKVASAGIIFVDDHVPFMDWLKINKDTKIVQLWHAGAGFKSSGYSRWGNVGCPSPVSAHRQYSFGIAGSKQIAPFFSEVWGINDEQVLATGMPRMDQFLNEEYRKKKTADLQKKYPIMKGKKVILFAPTYRGRNKKEAFYPYELLDLERLYDICGNEYVVLFKMHPWTNKLISIEKKYSDKFIDVTKYPNINDLFYITDLLITDYSSNIFEYSLMRKPMLFFAFDKIQYSFSRGFHRDYEESAPGKVCYTFDQLIKAIQDKDFEFEKVDLYVKHHFDFTDTHASDRVIDWILMGNIPESVQKELSQVEERNHYRHDLDFTFGGVRKSDIDAGEEA